MKKLFLLLVAVLSFSLMASAQTRSVNGTVVEEGTGDPIVGASVVPVGSKSGVTTDLDGHFTIQVSPSVKALEISFIGYAPQRVQIGNGPLRVALRSSIETKDEVIVVAYGTAKRSEYTGAAGVVKAAQLENSQVANVSNALSGKVSGVQTISSNGQPGVGSTVRIRGVGSINASTAPLYVVDGMPYDGDIAAIATNDIAEMTVLKDAASTALYGARGANGVILITTKKGSEGNAKVSLDVRVGANSRMLPNYDVISDQRQYLEHVYNIHVQSGLTNSQKNPMSGEAAHAYANANLWSSLGYQTWTIPTGQDAIGTNGRFNPYATPGYVSGDYMFMADDWTKESLINGLRQEYNLSVTGGTNKLQYYISGSYLGDEGIIRSSHFNRFSTRMNVDYQAKPWMKLGAQMAYVYQNTGYPGDQTNDASTSVGNVFGLINHLGPIYPMYIRDPKGNIRYNSATGNPIFDYGDAKNYGWGRTPSRNTMSSANPTGNMLYDKTDYLADVLQAKWYVLFTPLKGLSIMGKAGYDMDATRTHYIKNPIVGSGVDYKGQAIQGSDRSRTITLDAMVSYNRTFNDVHNMDLMFNFENTAYRAEGVEASGQNMYNPFSWAVSNTIDQRNGSGSEQSLVHRGFLGRAKYNYAGKYYFVVSARRDGSSRFHKNHRWGTFWALSGGWDVAKENFMKENTSFDMLKFRASFGQTGNDGIGYQFNAWADRYKISGAEGVWNDAQLAYKGNPDITWEKSNSFNAGFDFSLWHGKLSGTLDYYQRQTDDMLFNVPVAPSLGYSSVPMNAGSMRNNGFELDLNYRAINTKNVVLNINANITNGWNKVLKIEQKLLNTKLSWENDSPKGWLSGSRIFVEGQSMYASWLVKYAGVNTNNQAENNQTLDKASGEMKDDYAKFLGQAMYWARRDKKDDQGNKIPYTYKKDANGNNIVDPETGKPVVDQYVQEEYLTTDWQTAYNTNRQSTGNLMAKAYGGFGFDLQAYGIDLNVNCAYQLGGRIYDNGYAQLMNPGTKGSIGQAYHVDMLKAWTPNNPDSDVPRLGSGVSAQYATSSSTRFLVSSNYLSLNNITLGYTLPAKWTTPAHLNSVRFYCTAENVALWSARKGLDPRQGSVSSNNSTYSPMRSISGGVRVNF